MTSSDRDPIVHDFPVMDSLPPLEPHSPEMFSRNWVSEAASGDCDRGVTSGQRERGDPHPATEIINNAAVSRKHCQIGEQMESQYGNQA